MGKIIAVVSGKGGTGKTTSTAAISSCLAALGKKTLCIDFDAGLRNLDLSLCMTDFTVMDYMDMIDGKLELMEVCSENPHIPNLYFIAAPINNDPYRPDEDSLRAMFDEIREKFDYCVIDAPSGVGIGFKQACLCADMVIIVTAGELSAIRDAQHTAHIIRSMGDKEIRMIVNRVIKKNFKRIKATVDDLIDTIGVQLIGIVPEDKAVFQSLHLNIPLTLYKRKSAAYDYLDIARRILGEDIPLRKW
ncbi:MAG: AAA family ATPase [Oscillospiraceae bacterium]|nr:AAA family ATPase [Oscillospiraceae bacterium]